MQSISFISLISFVSLGEKSQAAKEKKTRLPRTLWALAMTERQGRFAERGIESRNPQDLHLVLDLLEFFVPCYKLRLVKFCRSCRDAVGIGHLFAGLVGCGLPDCGHIHIDDPNGERRYDPRHLIGLLLPQLPESDVDIRPS